ncbi:MAG: hypothetical protein ACRD68_11185 [Pyrinomonadaceae bacterium]
MRKKWLLNGGSTPIVIARRADIFPEELCNGDSSFPSANLEGWLSDPLARQSMIEIYESVHGRSMTDLRRANIDELRKSVKPWLEEAFKRRELVALPVPRRAEVAIRQIVTEQKNADAAKAKPDAPPATKTTFVEIELIDMADQPVAGARYRIQLPDGNFQEGHLDKEGRARADDIEKPGTCWISFPDLDKEAWERV